MAPRRSLLPPVWVVFYGILLRQVTFYGETDVFSNGLRLYPLPSTGISTSTNHLVLYSKVLEPLWSVLFLPGPSTFLRMAMENKLLPTTSITESKIPMSISPPLPLPASVLELQQILFGLLRLGYSWL